MKIYVKKLFQRFHELPENLPSNYYRSYVFINYAFLLAGLLHLLAIFLFTLSGVRILALYNILSVFIWALTIYLNLKGYLKRSFVLANLEVLLHAWLCTSVIGWNTGFHYYALVMPLIIFLTPWPTKNKAIMSALNIIMYFLMSYYSHISAPSISLAPIIIDFFHYFNILSFGFVISFFIYHYSAAVIIAEANLEREHRKTNEALIERNNILAQLDEELAEAAGYVKNMLPKPINKGPVQTDWRFIPSTSLGGDAFGYQWIDNNHFAIYLLDVSGHGVGAALLSVSVMNVLRSQTLPDTDFKKPEQVLQGLNIAFPGEENNDMFFTMWYGVYNKSTRKLSYASGGHPPALLISGASTDNSKAKLLRTPNYVIGGMAEATYKKKDCLVDERNTLYIFSDGVYEVEKSDGSMWRFQEFTDFINKAKTNGHSILDSLFSYAKKIGNSEKLEDDFTIVEVAFS